MIRIICLLLSLFPTLSGAQTHHCSFEEKLAESIAKNPDQQARIEAVEKNIHQIIAAQHLILDRSQVTIPVVVHVVWNKPEENISDKRIFAQLDMLNQVFSNQHPDLAWVPDEFKAVIGHPGLQFCLAGMDPEGRATSGIIRRKTDIPEIANTSSLFFDELGGSTAWDPSRYLNIWITGPFGNTGYASFPEDGDTFKDGVVLTARVVDIGNEENSWNNGRVAVHEIGHYLGLRHIWGNDINAADPECLHDDGFSDTPDQWRYTFECPATPQAAPFSCGSNDMYVNFMDYTQDECLSMFTRQQVAYMRSVLETYRGGLLTGNIPCYSFNALDPLAFSVYPEPGMDRIRLFMDPSAALDELLTIYDARGAKVFSRKLLLYNLVDVDIPDLQTGIYFVQILDHTEKVFID